MHQPTGGVHVFMRPDAAEYYAHQLTKSTAAVISERNGTPMVTSHLASRQAIMRDFLENFRPWIESVLRVEFAQTIIFEFSFGIAHIAAPYLVEGLLLGRSEESPQAELQRHLQSVEFPPDFVPAVGVSPYRKLGVSLKKRRGEWSGEWRDFPVALHFRGLGAPVVVGRFPFSQGPHDCHWGEVVLTPKANAAALLNLVETATQKSKRPHLHTINVGFQGVPHSSWSDL